jgi:hypothetical protein
MCNLELTDAEVTVLRKFTELSRTAGKGDSCKPVLMIQPIPEPELGDSCSECFELLGDEPYNRVDGEWVHTRCQEEG